jgi:hypothetical protein
VTNRDQHLVGFAGKDRKNNASEDSRKDSKEAGEPATPENQSEQVDPQKMEQIAERLMREGRMPKLEDFLKAIGAEREKYRLAILKAREEDEMSQAQTKTTTPTTSGGEGEE